LRDNPDAAELLAASPPTVFPAGGCVTALAAILETAVEYELIARNPAKGRKRRLPAIKPARSWLDRAEHITALLDGAGELDQQGRAPVGLRRPVIATLAFAGLRLGELRALYWHDVDLNRGTIRVREAKTDAGVRIVHMLPILRRELRVYRDQLHPGPNGRVFATSSGAPKSGPQTSGYAYLREPSSEQTPRSETAAGSRCPTGSRRRAFMGAAGFEPATSRV
jgi:integrase